MNQALVRARFAYRGRRCVSYVCDFSATSDESCRCIWRCRSHCEEAAALSSSPVAGDLATVATASCQTGTATTRRKGDRVFGVTCNVLLRRDVTLLIDATCPGWLHTSRRCRATPDPASLFRFLLAQSVQR